MAMVVLLRELTGFCTPDGCCGQVNHQENSQMTYFVNLFRHTRITFRGWESESLTLKHARLMKEKGVGGALLFLHTEISANC
jgi:hypothetical protein